MTKFEHFTKLPIIYGFDIYEYIFLPLDKLVSCGWLANKIYGICE